MNSARPKSAWSVHPARLVSLTLGFVFGVLGLAFGRADLALLGVPLILTGLWAREPTAEPGVRLEFADDNSHLVIAPSGQTDAIRVRLACDGHRTATVLLSGRCRQVDVGLHSARTGPQPPVRADWDAHGHFLMSYTPPGVATSHPMTVLPQYIPLGLVPESRRLRGLTGPATSNRPGDGFELRDVHPRVPSDSTRRIDWRVTARQTSEDSIWVKGTYATGEAVAILVMDSRDEVGPDLHTWRGSMPLRVDEPTSLDLARHAAASIARRLIESGNRVGLADLATGKRLLTPATGRRHLHRLTYALALSAPVGSPRIRVRPPQVPADAIVYLFSTLLDDESVRLVHALTSAGHQVLVIDTLPEVRPAAEVNMEMAWRITSAERNVRVRRLTAQHVPVIRWAGQSREAARQHFESIRRASMRPGARS